MQTLLGLSFCFALITAATALECEFCSASGSNCTGRMFTCERNKDTCIITVSVNSLGGHPSYTINKGCASSRDCHSGSRYLNLGHGKQIRSSTTCCVGDACKTARPHLPPDITKPNGKQCPACYIESSNKPCNPREKVDCVGPENLCLDMRLVASYANIIFRTTQKGCVDKLFCDDMKRSASEPSVFLYIFKKIECKPAPTTKS